MRIEIFNSENRRTVQLESNRFAAKVLEEGGTVLDMSLSTAPVKVERSILTNYAVGVKYLTKEDIIVMTRGLDNNELKACTGSSCNCSQVDGDNLDQYKR